MLTIAIIIADMRWGARRMDAPKLLRPPPPTVLLLGEGNMSQCHIPSVSRGILLQPGWEPRLYAHSTIVHCT